MLTRGEDNMWAGKPNSSSWKARNEERFGNVPERVMKLSERSSSGRKGVSETRKKISGFRRRASETFLLDPEHTRGRKRQILKEVQRKVPDAGSEFKKTQKPKSRQLRRQLLQKAFSE